MEQYNEYNNDFITGICPSMTPLLQMMVAGRSPQEMINAAAKLLDNALILVDPSYRVPLYSTNYEIVDPLWQEAVTQGYCSSTFAQKHRQSESIKSLTPDVVAAAAYIPGDQQIKLVTGIKWSGRYRGVLVTIIHHSQPSDQQKKLLPSIGWLLYSACVKNDILSRVTPSSQAHLLYQLLDGADLQDRMKIVNGKEIFFPEQMYVVVSRLVQKAKGRYIRRSLGWELDRIFPDGISFQYKNYISILVPDLTQHQEALLKELAPREGLSIGISWMFTDLAHFRRHFNQAKAAIKYAEGLGLSNEVYYYNGFVYYDLLSNYAGSIPLEHFAHPALTILKEYDKAKHTELYDTLWMFLKCRRKPLQTAKALSIHRNTLLYRIDRIQKLIGYEFTDINVQWALIHSYFIDGYLGMKNKGGVRHD